MPYSIQENLLQEIQCSKQPIRNTENTTKTNTRNLTHITAWIQSFLKRNSIKECTKTIHSTCKNKKKDLKNHELIRILWMFCMNAWVALDLKVSPFISMHILKKSSCNLVVFVTWHKTGLPVLFITWPFQNPAPLKTVVEFSITSLLQNNW